MFNKMAKRNEEKNNGNQTNVTDKYSLSLLASDSFMHLEITLQ